MALLSVSQSHHVIHPGGSRSMQCICTRASPLRSGVGRSRSRKDLVLNVSSKEKINPRDLFTFSYRFSIDIPMTETPGASIDEYLQNRPRIVGAVFPDKRKRTKISDVSCLTISIFTSNMLVLCNCNRK
ncbi:hypothetical protein GUJ93_ZPchr0006g42180 [Zizania palustris]|uniref:Uncharacterized protein n=1 Tax=Zizania palustris TaxID=103762 RepID=A0A8J5T3W2_ZIZPA|nr:hypothetical protein GUJ93_ZPchr0006g42180 [Zizania palustris]